VPNLVTVQAPALSVAGGKNYDRADFMKKSWRTGEVLVSSRQLVVSEGIDAYTVYLVTAYRGSGEQLS
jgi:hypothetical protein